MDLSPPIQMDILLNSWDKFVAVFADFPGSLNLKYITRQLGKRNANISTVTLLDDKGTCPLLEFLRSFNCSSKVLRLLFLNGVDVNANNALSHSALVTALHHHSNKTTMIKVMLEAGADVDTLRFYQNCALCVALKQHACLNVIKMLLRAGCNPNCGECFPPLFKATKYQHPKCRQEILKVLIDNGADLRALSYTKQSILCFALTSINSKQDVDLLIGLGIPTDACNVHGSPILCALDSRGGGALPTDIAESLLGPFENPMPGHDFLYTLSPSIRNPIRYPVPYMPLRLALQRPGSGFEGQYGTLMHAVTYNDHCSPELIELLASRGVPVGKLSSEGETPVHVALRMEKPVLSVLRALLRRGCPVEAKDWAGRTALQLAIWLDLDFKVLKVLLDAGASVTQQNGGISALGIALAHNCSISLTKRLEETILREVPNIPGKRRNWLYLTDKIQEIYEKLKCIGLECFKLMVLYSYLENQAFDVEGLVVHGRVESDVILDLASRCTRELSKMAKMEVGVGYTLSDFISRNLLIQSNVNHHLSENNFNFDKLLRILKNTKFTNYLGMILDRVPRKVMEMKLGQLRVCTVRYHPHLRVIILNYHCVSEIAKYLSNIDLMNMILAFHNCSTKRTSDTKKVENKKQRIK